jgi:uncharacterized protein DUF6429
MEYDKNKIDEAVLALLYLNADKNYNTWKSFDWQSMNRLHDNGLITNPISKAKSIYLTEEGFNKAKELFEKLFCT